MYTRWRVHAVLVTGLRGRGGDKTLVGGRSISTLPLSSYIIIYVYNPTTRIRLYMYIYIYIYMRDAPLRGRHPFAISIRCGPTYTKQRREEQALLFINNNNNIYCVPPFVCVCLSLNSHCSAASQTRNTHFVFLRSNCVFEASSLLLSVFFNSLARPYLCVRTSNVYIT